MTTIRSLLFALIFTAACLAQNPTFYGLNQTPVVTAAATPVFSPSAPAFAYGSNVSVSLSCSTPGSYICYTQNGTTPVPNVSGGCTTGTLYSTAYTDSSLETDQAVCAASGSLNSATATASVTQAPISFEADYGPFTALNSVSRSTTYAHSGTYSAKILGGSAFSGQLYKAVTFPASGSVTISSWVYFTGTFGGSGEVAVVACSTTIGVAAWNFDLFVASTGAWNYRPASGHGSDMSLYISPGVGQWYHAVVVYNLTTNNYTASVYNASGTILSSGSLSSGVSLGGTTQYLQLANYNEGAGMTVYFDDVVIAPL